jgi:hypothetical protein
MGIKKSGFELFLPVALLLASSCQHPCSKEVVEDAISRSLSYPGQVVVTDGRNAKIPYFDEVPLVTIIDTGVHGFHELMEYAGRRSIGYDERYVCLVALNCYFVNYKELRHGRSRQFQDLLVDMLSDEDIETVRCALTFLYYNQSIINNDVISVLKTFTTHSDAYINKFASLIIEGSEGATSHTGSNHHIVTPP